MRIDKLDPRILAPQPQSITAGGLVVDQPSSLRPRTATARSRAGYPLKHQLVARDFRRGCWRNPNSQMSTPAICDHHELCTLASLRFPDIQAAFFAGENVPLLNVSSNGRMPSSSSSPRSFLQSYSQAPASPHACSRRQHVAEDGYRPGRSFQRVALRNTHRTSSQQRPSSTRLRPPFFKGFRVVMTAACVDYCSSGYSNAWRLIERLLSISLAVASPCRAHVLIRRGF